MIKVKHTLYPISYYDDNGELIHTIYNWSPSAVQPDYFVGDLVVVELDHGDPNLNPKQMIAAQIAELQAKLEAMGDE